MSNKISLIFFITISLLISRSFSDISHENLDAQINELISFNDNSKIDKQYEDIQKTKLEIKSLNEKRFYLTQQKKQLKQLQINIKNKYEYEKNSYTNLLEQKQYCIDEIENIEKSQKKIDLRIKTVAKEKENIEEDLFYAQKNNHPELRDLEYKKIELTNELNDLKNQYTLNNSRVISFQKQLVNLDKQITDTQLLEKKEFEKINSQLKSIDNQITSVDKQVDQKNHELKEMQKNLVADLSKEKQEKEAVRLQQEMIQKQQRFDTRNAISSNSYNKENKKDSSRVLPKEQYIKKQKQKNERVSLFLIEIKPAYFYFQDNTFRHIYGHGACLTSFEADIRLKQDLRIWAEAGYLYKTGHVKSAYNAKAKITLVPVSFGLKYFVNLPKGIHIYAKIGPNWYYCKTKQNYAYVPSKITKKGYGATFGIGGLIYVGKDFYLDLFSNYLYDKKEFTDPTSNSRIKRYFGGATAGLGIGYQF